MKSLSAILLGLGVLIGPLATIARAADITAEEVRKSIALGAKYLKSSQRDDGSWPEYMGQSGGVTSLCTLALLNSGVDPQDPKIQQALKNLRQRRPNTTYVVALQTMVLCRAEPTRDQVLIGRNVEWLERNQIKEGPRAGMWSYPSGNGDASNTQFALLALHEAERAAEAGLIKGIRVRRDTWERAQAYWEKNQNPDGSWGYYPPLEGTGSMTCAGISSLVIAADMIAQPDAKVNGDEIDACARAENASTRPVERGIEWLRRHYSITQNPPGTRRGLWHLYYLYGLERAGRLTARRFIGEHDWYREGAEHLIRHLKQDDIDGFFPGREHAEDDRNISTSLALLFLSKGRWPVLIAKLRHTPGEEWNQRRHDIHNMTLYVESKWKRDLTWQIVDLEQASVEDLQQSPVIFFSGSQSPLPEGDQQRKALALKIRGYLDRGGFLFAEEDTCASGFDKAFRDFMDKQVFPEPEYKLHLLDPSHPIWHFDEKVAEDQQRPIWGVDFGCRTSVAYFPRDGKGQKKPLSSLWELSRAGRYQKFSRTVQAQIDAALSIGINVLGYATNREFDDERKLAAMLVREGPRDKVERGRLEVVKLRHPGGCDSAPRALSNLMQAIASNLKVRVDRNPKLINIGPGMYDYPMVFMHGRNRFRFTETEEKALRLYIERGGLLFADSICSSAAFTESFQAEMKRIFPKNSLEDIPTDPIDSIWTQKYGGFDLRTVTRRDPQPAAAGGPVKAALRKVAPKLKGIKFGDRYGVIFSEFDISCALEKQDSLECRGYVREDAARIGMNVLLYANQQ
jgi:hypothetical protein